MAKRGVLCRWRVYVVKCVYGYKKIVVTDRAVDSYTECIN